MGRSPTREPASHLFSPRGDFKNFHYRAEIKINDKGNSGMYFRTKKESGFPHGYEAQINSTHRDPVKTGSLYNSREGQGNARASRHLVHAGGRSRRQSHHHQGQRQDHGRL